MTETFLGILELTDRGTAFVRRRESGYSPADGDLFVPPHIVKQYGLRTGDAIDGEGGRGGKGRAVLQRGELTKVIYAEPAPPVMLDEGD